MEIAIMGVIMEFAHFLVTPTLVENPELAGVFLHNKSTYKKNKSIGFYGG